MVRIPDFSFFTFTGNVFSAKTEELRRYGANSRLFLTSQLLEHVFSTKTEDLGGMVRIHDFFYSGFTGSHFQLTNGGF